MADLNITNLITRSFFTLLFAFIIYLAYKYRKKEKVGKTAKVFAWIAGILLIISSIFVLIIVFFAFQSPDLTYPLVLVLILLAIFSLSFIFLGAMMILVALGKLKKG
ncbi:hypothetical protein HYV49_00015 [Candidatus Pacearchaeota archaeon]|nr:hypothetical protein [Candidatus Pacearchaeota archaeon]